MLEVTDYVAKSTRFIARRRPGNRGRRLSGDLGVTSIYLQGSIAARSSRRSVLLALR